MTGKNETVYIKINRNIRVTEHKVTINDIASLSGTNDTILRQIKQIHVYSFAQPGNTAVSIMKIIDLIQEAFPDITVVNVGEMDFLLEYRSEAANPVYQKVKLVLVWILIFFGEAFTIMAFHNDIDITGVFDTFYYQIMGTSKPKVSQLKICYSIGLAAGIIIFFNHVGNKKITHDPTPIQVELRKYEQDVDTTFIENASRKGDNIDVS